jgi:hypothetical protein
MEGTTAVTSLHENDMRILAAEGLACDTRSRDSIGALDIIAGYCFCDLFESFGLLEGDAKAERIWNGPVFEHQDIHYSYTGSDIIALSGRVRFQAKLEPQSFPSGLFSACPVGVQGIENHVQLGHCTK